MAEIEQLKGPATRAEAATGATPEPLDLALLIAGYSGSSASVDIGLNNQRRAVSRPAPTLFATASANAVIRRMVLPMLGELP